MRTIPALLSLALVFQGARGLGFAQEVGGFRQEAGKKASAALDQLVENNKIAGGMHLVVLKGQRVHFHIAGVSDIDEKTKLKPNALLRIYSMSKPITSLAAMTLWEQGKFKLDDPVSKFIPAFKLTRVQIQDGQASRLVDAKREITVRDVFRHTTGFTYGRGKKLEPYYAAAGILYDEKFGMFPPKMSIAQAAERLARIPAEHHPGERFTYGFNTDLLGRLIEIWSGKTLDVYMAEAVFKPLGMRDTAFAVGQNRKGRLASCHTFDKNGKQFVCDKAADSPFVDGFEFLSGGGGLISTIDDYAKFCQLIVDKGKVGQRRLLKATTIDLMLTNQLKGSFQFGLGFAINEVTIGTGDSARKAKAYRWGGYASTAFQIVPEEKLFQITMRQSIRSPNTLSQKVFPIAYAGIK